MSSENKNTVLNDVTNSLLTDVAVSAAFLTREDCKKYPDNLYTFGITRIAGSQFQGNGVVTNPPPNSTVKQIAFKINFDNLKLSNPVGNDGRPIYPTQVLNSSDVYGGQLTGALKVELIPYGSAHDVIAEKRRTVVAENIVFGRIPILTGSSHCNLKNLSADELLKHGEDPHDFCGYYVIQGSQYVPVCSWTQTMNDTKIVITRDEKGLRTEAARVSIMSKAGINFENSYETIISLTKNGMIYMQFKNNSAFGNMKIPFNTVFNMLGITTDEQIFELIALTPDNPNFKLLTQVLVNAYREPSKSEKKSEDAKYTELRKITAPQKVFEYICRKMIASNFPIAISDKDSQEVIGMKINEAMTKFNEVVLPHVGHNFPTMTDYDKSQGGLQVSRGVLKARFVAHMIRSLILSEKGVVTTRSRHDIIHCRVDNAGVTMSKLIKKRLNLFLKSISDSLKEALQKSSIESYTAQNLSDAAKEAATKKQSSIEHHLVAALITASRNTEQTKTQKTGGAIAMELRHYESPMKVLTALRTTKKRLTQAIKTPGQRIPARKVMQPGFGLISPTMSPDTGPSVGLHSQFTLMTRITSPVEMPRVHLDVICKIAREIEQLTGTRIFYRQDLVDYAHVGKMCMFKYNGDIIGWITHPYLFAEVVRAIRRGGHIRDMYKISESRIMANYVRDAAKRIQIPEVLEISIDYEHNILEVNTDGGRMYTYNLIMYRDEQGNVYTKLRKEDVRALERGEVTFTDLLHIFDPLSMHERRNCVLANGYDDLCKKLGVTNPKDLHDAQIVGDILNVPTHFEIPYGAESLAIALAPYTENAYVLRRSFWGQQCKHATCYQPANFPNCVHKNTYQAFILERPLVATRIDTKRFIGPYGVGAKVAFMNFAAGGLEDSIIISENFARWFTCTGLNMSRIDLADGVIVGRMPIDNASSGINPTAYENIDANGIVKVGTILQAGDIMVAAYKEGQQRGVYSDASHFYKSNFKVRVVKVTATKSGNQYKYIYIHTEQDKPISVGDKFANRHGQKAVVSYVMAQDKMPCDENGMTPHIIFNLHSLPTRMTLSQLLEMLAMWHVVLRCERVESNHGDSFTIDQMLNSLNAIGAPYNKVRMIDPTTGIPSMSYTFVGDVYYTRQQKFADDTFHASSSSKTDPKTRYPVDKAKQAGSGPRIGEMEAVASHANGIFFALGEKLHSQLATFAMVICRNCNEIGYANAKSDKYDCPNCGKLINPTTVETTFPSLTLMRSLTASNIEPKLHVDPGTLFIKGR
jgi:DNA-directed RNA polymerase beta subunit